MKASYTKKLHKQKIDEGMSRQRRREFSAMKHFSRKSERQRLKELLREET